jgi:iron complex outermembrane receptor protein
VPGVLAYVTWSRGFKSGAFVNGPNPPVDPEKVTAYEAGFKSEFFDRNLLLNLAAFHYDFTDLQVNRVVGAIVLTENAAEAKIDGVEAEIHALLGAGFSLDASLAWLDARYEEYVTADPARLALGPLDLADNRMPTAPQRSAFANLKKRFGLSNGSELTLAANYRWRDDQYFDPFNQRNAFQEAYGELGARLQWVSPSGAATVALWGQNLTDEKALLAVAVSSELYGFPRLASVNEPRTYGVEFTFKY